MSVRKARNLAFVCLGLLVCVPVSVSFEGHTHHIARVISSPDGTILARLSNDNATIVLFDQTTGEERAWRPGSLISSMAFSPDGMTLVSEVRWYPRVGRSHRHGAR